ncbi:MAG TPA: GntR family transcriptional regulator [Burkholderiales bacterium]|nr:GntR family transcriptional regulator [Burkholderiales bacterium]
MQAAITPITRQPLHELAVDRLRDLIVQGDLSPGERLNERMLCERLGISRTPLREAIKLLATEGLVRLLPHRGAQVAPLEARRLADTLEVMGAMEALAGELACRQASAAQLAGIRALHDEMLAKYAARDLAGYFRCNQAIHLKIVEAGGNPVLAGIYRQLNANVLRARYMANLSQERWDAAMREHEAIMTALEARDAQRLTRLLREHLALKLAAVLNAVEKAA